MENDILEELYRKYYSSTLLYCTSLCTDQSLAEDIVADAFVKAYLSLPDDVPSFQYWLLRVCRNLWFDHLRKNKWNAGSDALLWIADHRTPENIFLANEQQRTLWQAINTLSTADRELVVLHYFVGLPLCEISAILNKSYAAVRQRLHRLRRTLKTKMEEQGYGF